MAVVANAKQQRIHKQANHVALPNSSSSSSLTTLWGIRGGGGGGASSSSSDEPSNTPATSSTNGVEEQDQLQEQADDEQQHAESMVMTTRDDDDDGQESTIALQGASAGGGGGPIVGEDETATTNELIQEEEKVDEANDTPPLKNDDDDDDDTTPVEQWQHQQNQSEHQPPSLSAAAAREEAHEQRLMGKDLHDAGKWHEAAIQFHTASLLLEPHVNNHRDDDEDDQDEMLQEYATCRLHEALCHLKAHDYAASVDACTAVLENRTGSQNGSAMNASIRARALYRRSRAKLGLVQSQSQQQQQPLSHHDETTALEDARQAAFLGDRRAVALYGKLMRQEHPDASSMNSGSELSDALSSSSSASALQDLFQQGGDTAGAAGNPFLPSRDASSSALLESLLGKRSGTGLGGTPPGSAGGPLASMFMNNMSNNGGSGSASLAKSVLSSLSKTVEKESTQETICRYLQHTSVSQMQQMASMAGVPLSESQASKLVNFCHGVTPRRIQQSVRSTKRAWYVISLLRKVGQILQKYRLLLILWALSVWTKSAILRPIPINKRAAAAALRGS